MTGQLRASDPYARALGLPAFADRVRNPDAHCLETEQGLIKKEVFVCFLNKKHTKKRVFLVFFRVRSLFVLS